MKFKFYTFYVVLFISGCAAIGTVSLDRQFGKAEPRDLKVQVLAPDLVDYWREVKPVIEDRCIVCHGCYDAPCQLKMTSIEGIVRGANEQKVYNSLRLNAASPTRLFTDAQSVQQWREKKFYPVLNERNNTAQANREASVLYQLLELKKQNPLPDVKQLPKDNFTLSLNRKQECPTAENVGKFVNDHPQWGMPYALPGLTDEEHDIVSSWIEQGANYTPRAALPQPYIAQQAEWELWLNRDSLKQRLSSRYIYEHLSYAHLYFSELEEPRFFNLVRSSTPPGKTITIIPTRLPYDDPGVDRVYYRLQEAVSSTVEKAHMPYALNSKRMTFWQQLFIDADYQVTELPGYNAHSGANPFQTFASLPVNSRYKFMLEEAQFTIMAFMKGPVCRGEVAVDVIDDHFWVFFTNPDQSDAEQNEAFLANLEKNLHLPADYGTIYRPLHRWHQFKDQQKEFLQKKAQYLVENVVKQNPISLDLIWDGDGTNNNASLTVFRHFDNASVEKGLVGKPPQTSWLIDYSLLERIHYLLVAGYDVYSNLGQQLDTRLYMDLLRMEGESNFLLLLPSATRLSERDFWYRGASDDVKSYVQSPVYAKGIEPNIPYQTDNQKLELYQMLEARLQQVIPQDQRLSSVSNPQTRAQLQQLENLKGAPLKLLPNVAMVQIADETEDVWVSLVHNAAYSSVNAMFNESNNRLTDEDTLSVVPGFIGSYPNAFYVVQRKALPDFISDLSSMKTEVDYVALLDTYGIRRTNPDFWTHSDNVHRAFRKVSDIEFGRFDYGRLENR